MKYIHCLATMLLLGMHAAAQTPQSSASGGWQQKVKYNMDIRMDVQKNQFTGKQRLEYTNQSPDTLTRLFYHLYWNAFQPNSMMDVRSRELGKKTVNNRPDWDARVKDRIEQLKPDEIGYQKILRITMNGVEQTYKVHETILEVILSKPILPRSKAVLEMDFEAQVPVQIRRSGRDNAEGIRYSMSQWYPKICAYDQMGWHPTPYIAREFHGEWGDFSVKITIDSSYVLGGTGYLQNAQQIGHGYEAPGTKVVRPAGNMLTWHFEAPNVHDFMWAADPEYTHISKQVNGVTLHVLYEARNAREDSAWRDVLYATEKVLPYIEKRFGKYPYKQYSFIQGGDGGMEYAMSTLLKGPGLGTVFHEWMHTWYQFLMATNESLFPWMDEGFTSWAESEVSAWYYANHAGLSPFTNERQKTQQQNNARRAAETQPAAHASAYAGYFALAKSGREEPMTTHADHYETNFAYSVASYSKGEVFLEQLGYIMGAAARDQVLQEYYRQWSFSHPDVLSFIRVAEKVGNMKLDWYREYWVNTTKTIDYAIDSLWEEGAVTKIRLRRDGLMPMPVDVQLRFSDGTAEMHYVPLYLMFGAKAQEDMSMPFKTYESWKWTHPTYIIETTRKLRELNLIEIDPSQRMADVERRNNKLELKW